MISLPRQQIASVAGIVLAVTFPFFPFAGLFERLQDRFGVSSQVLSMILVLTITTTLALVAFGVQKRSVSFFHIRGFGWRDLGEMFIALIYAYGLVLVATRLVEHFAAGKSSGPGEAEEIPLALGLTMAVVAGIAEEFIYRGFIIEELGELVGNRRLAGAFSIVAFDLAHYSSGYGWSITLLYPGLVGLVITVLYFRRGNLLICVLMHVLIDALHYWGAASGG
jgi:membrane protease YdiL (CAAX protease family)